MLLNNLTLAVMFLKELLQNPLEQYREEDTNKFYVSKSFRPAA